MKLTRFVAPVLALALLTPAATVFAAQRYAPPAYGFQPGWDTPPGEYREFQKLGFRDGIEGARKDFENHRPFTPENRDEYRNPHVPKHVFRDYREAFREGYHRAEHNLKRGR